MGKRWKDEVVKKRREEGELCLPKEEGQEALSRWQAIPVPQENLGLLKKRFPG